MRGKCAEELVFGTAKRGLQNASEARAAKTTFTDPLPGALMYLNVGAGEPA